MEGPEIQSRTIGFAHSVADSRGIDVRTDRRSPPEFLSVGEFGCHYRIAPFPRTLLEKDQKTVPQARKPVFFQFK